MLGWQKKRWLREFIAKEIRKGFPEDAELYFRTQRAVSQCHLGGAVDGEVQRGR